MEPIDPRILLAITWIALMLIFLLGDVLRIFAGHFTPGEMAGQKIKPGMMLGISVLMLLPIMMVLLSVILPQEANRWTNIVLAGLWFLFNAIGIPSYEGAYDKFLLAVSLLVNVLTAWIAWNWGLMPA